MIRISFIVHLFFIIACIKLPAQHYDFNAACLSSYQDIIALKLKQGERKLHIEKQINPSNQIPTLLENYIDFLTVYTSGSLSEYEEVKRNFNKRISVLKANEIDNPYALYCQAEIHIQSAVLHIKFGSYVASVLDIRKALKKLERNKQRYPNFIPNDKSLGMLYAILGSIPVEYHNALSFLGLKRDITKGMNLLKKASLNDNHPFQHESTTIYAFMLLHIQNETEKAWQIVNTPSYDASTNKMDAYTIGHIGVYGTHNDEGLAALQNASNATVYSSFPLLHYLTGLGKTHRQDDDANTYFNLFLNTNQGEDYVKSAMHKMAWNELIRGNTQAYHNLLKSMSEKGRAVMDTDKQAQREYEEHHVPNAVLLKARLLTDGNYLDEALELLENRTVNSFIKTYEKTEYFYRLARIYDKKNKKEKAIKYYLLSIENGKNVPYYYAANAAYLLAYLYETEHRFSEANAYYERCLELEGYEYENSIHQKAEAGLNRIK